MRKHGELGTGMKGLHTSDIYTHSANRFSSTAIDEKDRTMHFPVLPKVRAHVYHHVNLSQGFTECEDMKC